MDPLRPVGHITELVTELSRWAEAREKIGLRAALLRKAVAYLLEYRDLINILKQQGE